jgi:plasmid rolling circle replication initiator protein Rep
MTKICQISQKSSVEISQNFNTIPFCSNNETFDPDEFVKPWKNKARRKFVSSILSKRLQEYELTLPKSERGSWNSRIAFQYVPRVEVTQLPWENENELTWKLVQNKYGETLYEPTDIEKIQSLFYNHADNTGNQLRWKRLQNCLSEIKEAVDQTTGEVIYKATYKCNDKLCGNCSQIRSVVAVTKYKSKVQAMKSPVMVVLHQKSPKMGELKETINAMYSDWREILRLQAKSKRENYNGICALEVTTNEKDKTYHPHYHIIIEKHQADELVNKWVSRDPINRTLFAHTNKQTRQLYSDLIKDEKGNFTIKELFKYAMKMSVTNQDKPGTKHKTIGSTEMIYEIAKALKGVQQWRPFGDFRATPNTKEISKAIQDEMTVTQGEWPHIRLSKSWKWNKHDWEAHDIPGMNLTDYKPQKQDIAFLRLSQQEINNFVNERLYEPSDKFEQFIGLQITQTPGNDTTIQDIPGNETIKRSIHHNKQPSS